METTRHADDQTATIAFLADPATHEGAVVERVETHCAIVFLAGDRAYKLKRAVAYDFLDFTTLAARKRACDAELSLNRRTAPQVYERLACITRQASGSLALDGAGEIIDWVVVMRRFPADGLFDARAEVGTLAAADMVALADEIAAFHEAAERVIEPVSRMEAVAEGNLTALARWAGAPFDKAAIAATAASLRRALEAARPRLDARAADGHVRVAHGDLHLANVCTIDGQPVIFDALEFDPGLACIDILYDLAFLVMDLWTRGFESFAHLVLERWIARTGDDADLSLLPLFLGLRAIIRAHVAAATLANAQLDKAAAGRLRAIALERLLHARIFLAPPPPRLVAIGGLSGSGKSTVARLIAPGIGAPPGARVLRTDVTRKRLAGIAETERLPPAAYTPEANEAVYARILADAEVALGQGRAVILDGVFARPGERDRAAYLAQRLGVRFDGIWLEAPAATLTTRVGQRIGDASDADASVIARQLDYDLGQLDWTRLATDGTPAAVAGAAASLLARPPSGVPTT